jgi:hypothetical protein
VVIGHKVWLVGDGELLSVASVDHEFSSVGTLKVGTWENEAVHERVRFGLIVEYQTSGFEFLVAVELQTTLELDSIVEVLLCIYLGFFGHL